MRVRLKTYAFFTATILALGGATATAADCLLDRLAGLTPPIGPTEANARRVARGATKFAHSPIMERFIRSDRMLYKDPQVAPFPDFEFHASNEFDWFLTPLDLTPTDTVVGFGTNSVWDLAVRKNAKQLVIADWHLGTLLTQEYLLRPLLLEARSPQEFLSFLAGVPLHAEASRGPLAGAFAHLNAGLLADAPDRGRFVTQVLDRMERNPSISPDQLKGVSSYYNDLLNQQYHRGPLPGMQFGPLTGSFVQRVQTPDGPLWPLFNHRYNPERLRAQGAPRELVESPFYSFLSSQEAFERLRKLFDGNVHYAHTSYDDPRLYDAVRAKSAAQGHRSHTLSITNILDVLERTPLDQRERLRNLIRTAARTLASPEAPLVIFRSMNTRPPHRFGTYVIHNEADIEKALTVDRGRGTINTIKPILPGPR